jgi:hypothetical protein
MAKIVGIEGINPQQLASQLQSGARFVQYQYCVSALIITFRRATDIYFLRADESPKVKGLNVDAAYLSSRMVGNSLGTDLYCAIYMGEPARLA